MDQAPTHEPETQQTEHAGHRSLLGLYWVVLLLPVLYVLSIGPAAKLEQAGAVSNSLVGTVYYPVIRVAMRSKPFSKFLGWYLHDIWRCNFD